MCCWTHDERDKLDKSLGIEFALASSPHFRCTCNYGLPCHREQTPGPMLLCAWCASENHGLMCEQINQRQEDEYRQRQEDEYRQKMLAPVKDNRYESFKERLERRGTFDR